MRKNEKTETEYEILEWQYFKANARGDYETAEKLAKILSQHNHKNPELRDFFRKLGICNT